MEVLPGPLLVVFTDQIWSPIKLQKEEKLTNLITNLFTINQVPHVFGEYHFAGHTYKYKDDFTERCFVTMICAKEQGRHPPNQLKMG
jgi:hypothetical protein